MQTVPKTLSYDLRIDGFELWFQPVYDVTHGTVSHNEVLLRWQDELGQVHLPAEFMPLVSKAALNPWLDRLVIQKSVQKLRENPRATLSVNLSNEIFQDFDILDYIFELTQTYRIQPHQLNFELSEQSIARHYHDATRFIQVLKELGFAVVLDNYANQYLTFLQWERLALDSVKLDGRLIRSVPHDSQQSLLAKSIIQASEAMGQASVAKSIDSLMPSRWMGRLAFDSAQGYHLKRPSRSICLTSKIDLLGVPIDNLTQEELLQELKTGIVFTPNVDHLMNIRKRQRFFQAYNAADYKICDSQILVFASRFLGTPVKERISGSDLLPAFYMFHKDNPEITMFLLGGGSGVAAQARANINMKAGREIVIDAYSPSFGFETSELECLQIVKRINQSKATVLAVGVGAPKQEEWIYKYKDQLTSVQIIFAVGATLDFEAGVVSRAPRIVSNLGIEWFYRLMSEPRRLWKRYLVNDLPFLWLLFQQKIKNI
ncbi:WecB/TagA/CpsF family glycosyltransferase [Synechococcales cyanobacterium C]|uniref:WecB/TagA/CpsF family glycosyltransferase n=1 Tax=Petrachloros mirabilis ULC683 TaxID=2781853 RepID=A0A8K1ZVU3_9CYAN|nr:WecB/TagA/CpsF family glycosyltransferase [Petrachloros mirabilis]NCJ06150.1 WecB/TagA/CpsF family glycosyltransferase [Petrachloros mirabilis ULC683]